MPSTNDHSEDEINIAELSARSLPSTNDRSEDEIEIAELSARSPAPSASQDVMINAISTTSIGNNEQGVDESSSSGSDRDADYVPRNRLFQARSFTSSESSTFSAKRKSRYVHKTGVLRHRVDSKRKTQRISMLTLTDDEIRSKRCCSTIKCFTVVNLSRLRQSMTSVFSSSRKTRRSILSQMYTSTGHFIFDGNKVCSLFLIEAFRFSAELQSSVRIALGGTVEVTQLQLPSHPVNNSESNSVSGHNSRTVPTVESDRSVKRDAIITFLHRTANATANFMPDNDQRHLPYVNKISVYERFKQEFNVLYPTVMCPSEHYFYKVWKAHCVDIKVRRSIRFTKCSTCERIRKALLDANAKNLNTDALLQQQSEHLEFIKHERLEYKSKVELAKLKPLEYLSIVVDGADQSAYTLPHFIFDVKDQRGLGLKVHLIGLLHHSHKSCLQLYTMTDEHQKGANHIVEVIHRFLNDKATEGPLPRKLFIQLDNCSRENKNRFLMSYLDGLVRWAVFDEIEAGFLPVGHTHCDIDQAFSSTSNRLNTHDAITLEDLQAQLRCCYNDKTRVMCLKQVVNWSGLCDETDCCNNIDHITHYRYFKFCLTQSRTASNDASNSSSTGQGNIDVNNSADGRQTITRLTTIKVRHTSRDNWIPLESVSHGTSSFLRILPDLSQTPPELISSPDEKDKVSQRIDSEASRIGSEEKLLALLRLRDEVFCSRSVKFHWDLSQIIEMRAQNARRQHDATEQEVASLELSSAPQASRLRYEMDSFVAVLGGSVRESGEVWIGQIVDRIRHNDGTIRYLKVHWFEKYGDGDCVTGKYRALFLKNPVTKKKDIPWLDKITCDSVLICFANLTSKRRLPILVANDLRERLPSTSQ